MPAPDEGASPTKKERERERLRGIMRRSLGDDIFALFSNDDITEIYKNPHEEHVRVDSHDRGTYKTDYPLTGGQAQEFLKAAATYMGLDTEFGANNPEIQGELPEEDFCQARLQGFTAPISRTASLIIRKPATRVYSLRSYVENGFMTASQMEAIRQAVADRDNILVIGGTGSGKTTLTNAIIQDISRQCPDDRLVILEDTRELQSDADDKLQLLTSEDEGLVDLVKYTLRCSPDRIVVGECRDETALHMLDAWSTGHPGGVCTVHSDTIAEGLQRLDRLSQRASQNPVPQLVGKAVDFALLIEGGNVERNVADVQRVHRYDGASYVTEPVA